MSQLKISPNLFLEVQELKKLIYFLSEDGYKPFLKHLTKSFGIAQNENNTYFKVSRKSGSEDTVIINSGIAFNQNLDKIYLGENKEIVIPNTGENQWLVISYNYTNDEQGTVDVSTQGVLNGKNTKFTSVLRGQPNFPTKVKFNSKLNTEEYEVVNISSDTVATIVGDFIAEKDLKYQVIGTFTPGFQPDDENKTIYEYDSCKIEIIESEDRPDLLDGQYVIAKTFYNNGILAVEDERIRNLFNYEQKIDENVNTNTLQSDSFVALRQTTMRSENLLDVQFEWGFTVNRFEIINTSEQNIFNILSGSSQFISLNRIPNGIFAGWLLVNRKNMVSVVIDNNSSNKLYISKYNPLIITNEGDDEFVIVPNCKDIEVEVTLDNLNIDVIDTKKLKYDISKNILIGTLDKSEISSNLIDVIDTTKYGKTKFFFKFSIENVASRFILPIEYGQTFVNLKYRIISSLNETTKFQDFSNSKFINIKGDTETLGESSFIVIINKPEEVQRNYS